MMSNEPMLTFSRYEKRAIATALRAMDRVMREAGVTLDRPAAVFDYLGLKLSALEHEVFTVLYLDAQNRLIAYEELFRGTVSQTAVYPREIVKRALAHNASAVVLAHNHPSGLAEPSSADRLLTDSLKQALQFVGTTVLDHIIVAGPRCYSFAEHGLI
jgi:DNA repair protein RadC